MMRGNVLLINIPPKVWRPKMINKYTPTNQTDDIGEGCFDFKQYGKTMFRPLLKWDYYKWDDTIKFNEVVDKAELVKYIRICKDADIGHKETILGIVIKYWDCFCKKGARRTIINYEFAVDTGTAKPVCYRKPRYGPYESKIILDLMKDLLKNDWI